MNDKDFTKSGAPIIRHSPREKEFELALGEEDSIEIISDHIEKHLGKITGVYHEIIFDLVHIDVHCIAPTPERNFYTFVTSGMSDKAMSVPEGLEAYRFAELMISIPPTWPVSDEAFEAEDNYWPIRWLKTLARLPHEYDTWLGYGHTVPNGDPAEPFSTNTKLSCMMVSIPQLVNDPEGFFELRVNDIKKIHFYNLMPIYKEETTFKLKHGADDLIEKFNQQGITEIINVNRQNVCKRSLWPFT